MKIAIIGAGSAGIFLSLFLRDLGGGERTRAGLTAALGEVCLFEQNPKIGEKLKLTGGGRMNVTNRVFGVGQFFSSNKNLLKNLFKSPWFSDDGREKLLKELGIEYKWEGDRAILKSEDAVKEVDRLLLALKGQRNIHPRMGCKVVDIKKIAGGGKAAGVGKAETKFIVKYFKSKKKSDNEFVANYFEKKDVVEEIFDIVVICGGGMLRLGDVSDEKEIYKIARGLGHSVTTLSPALCPLRIEKSPLSKFSGVDLKVGLKNVSDKHEIVGNILITHGGISGPVALDFSSTSESGKIEINFLPDLKESEFIKKFKEARNGKIRARGFLKEFLPVRISDFHLEKIGIKKEANVADVSAENEKTLIKNLFHLELNATKFSGYSSAWTTRGGVPLNEVNVATLESRICPGVYFAGEVLDVNGFCGGYNVSFAMVSAKIVSEAITKRLKF